jgi:hypothetical protein
MKKEGFSVEEMELVQPNGTTHDYSFSNAATILAAKKYERAIDRLIKSNESLGRSNDKHSLSMLKFTGMLALIALSDLLMSDSLAQVSFVLRIVIVVSLVVAWFVVLIKI